MDRSALESTVRGRVLGAGDAGYDEARTLWNMMFDRKPALIVQCLGAGDVRDALAYAKANGLPVAVKGGGHGVAGYAVVDGGLVIDLSLMRTVHVDPAKKTARVAAGCLLGDVDRETQLHGLAVPAGIVSHTGVAGLTLGGGFGWISRKHGFTVDNLLSVELVTADGRVLTVSQTEHPDLFWGIRGGGGNFGVATSFEFRCAEIGTELYSGLIVHRLEDAPEYLRFARDYVRTLPDEITVWHVLRHAPPLPFLPPEVHGKMMCAVAFLHLGDPAEGEKLIRPLLEFKKPYGHHVGMNPFAGWQTGFDALNSHGARNYWKSHHLKGLPDDCIDKVVFFAGRLPSPHTEIFIAHMEGAPSRVSEDATAFAFRKQPFVMNVHTRWEQPSQDESCIAWARKFYEETKPYAEGVYVNFLSDGENRAQEAYSTEAWKRLVGLKKEYDPENLFRMNQNIPPGV